MWEIDIKQVIVHKNNITTLVMCFEGQVFGDMNMVEK